MPEYNKDREIANEISTRIMRKRELTRTEIPLHSLNQRQQTNIFYCRPICYASGQCDEAKCRSYQKENINTEKYCYLKE